MIIICNYLSLYARKYLFNVVLIEINLSRRRKSEINLTKHIQDKWRLFLWWRDDRPLDDRPRRHYAPETLCPETLSHRDIMPRVTLCPETICPGDTMPR